MDKAQLSIWDDAGDAEEPSTSSGSGLKREVTPGVTTSSSSQQQPPPTTATKEEINLDELRQKLEEQDMVDSLEDALENEPVVEASSSTTPVDKRRRKKAKNKIEIEPGPPVDADPYEEKPISVKDDVEDEVNVEFLAQLIAADDAKQRKDRRQQLLKETEA